MLVAALMVPIHIVSIAAAVISVVAAVASPMALMPVGTEVVVGMFLSPVAVVLRLPIMPPFVKLFAPMIAGHVPVVSVSTIPPVPLILSPMVVVASATVVLLSPVPAASPLLLLLKTSHAGFTPQSSSSAAAMTSPSFALPVRIHALVAFHIPINMLRKPFDLPCVNLRAVDSW
jgi:hypothetical protein